MLQLTINVAKSKFVLSVIQVIFNGDWQLKVVSRGLSNEFQACLNILIYLASYVSWISVQNWCWLNKQCYVLKYLHYCLIHIYIGSMQSNLKAPKMLRAYSLNQQSKTIKRDKKSHVVVISILYRSRSLFIRKHHSRLHMKSEKILNASGWSGLYSNVNQFHRSSTYPYLEHVPWTIQNYETLVTGLIK